MEEPRGIDKRTKEYKEWKKWKALQDSKSKGLGDTVEKITKATGIKAFVDLLSDDCGCEERKESLNKLFPYKKTNYFTEQDFNWLRGFFDANYKVVNPQQQKRLNKIYNHVFPPRSNKDLVKATNCTGCLKRRINELKKLMNV
jgi:hypothetical protein